MIVALAVLLVLLVGAFLYYGGLRLIHWSRYVRDIHRHPPISEWEARKNCAPLTHAMMMRPTVLRDPTRIVKARPDDEGVVNIMRAKPTEEKK